jgi:NAD(P)-dependent dehydrogenase (short-subunit alcohol dehydrogenase family)
MTTPGGQRVAVVTGAGRGIGQALASRLAVDGLAIVVADLEESDETMKMLADYGASAMQVVTDVSQPDDVKRLADLVEMQLGSVDVLVANAGIYPVAPFLETSWETWRKIMGVNLDSLFLLTQAFLPGMQRAGWGRIIATATNGFYTGLPDLTPYVASKGGVIGFVRSLAGEVGVHGVTVNAFAPTLTRTPGTSQGIHDTMGLFDFTRSLQAIKRTGRPRDVAGVVSFLASDDAEFITGQTIAADGGMVRG